MEPNNISERDKAFLGVGLAFPPGVDSSGRLLMNSLEDHVRQSILLLMRTAQGQRVMRPDFGSGLERLVFAPITGATSALVQHTIKQTLIQNEPRIDTLSIEVTPDTREAGVLTITLQYRIRSTDTMFNLVYPFYLERGQL